jgi:long-subunit acyl-CoA synthetase (AMP-forming)
MRLAAAVRAILADHSMAAKVALWQARQVNHPLQAETGHQVAHRQLAAAEHPTLLTRAQSLQAVLAVTVEIQEAAEAAVYLEVLAAQVVALESRRAAAAPHMFQTSHRPQHSL